MHPTCTKILLVGCGAMGNALRQGWQPHKDIEVLVIDPQSAAGIDMFGTVQELPEDYQPDVVLFAIKPQIATDVVPYYALFNQSDTLFISIMAGVSVAKIKQLLGGEAAIIRTMPNLPAVVGEGVTGIYSEATLQPTVKQKVTDLFSGIGATVWVEAEDHLNSVTAISGSGPAYFFRLVEAMATAGEQLGLSKDIADQLARQTLVGAGALLSRSQESVEQLRIKVTSPGGTTAAALSIFEADNALDDLILKAATAAFHRAKEL
ncbi:pyrroline-5-carboxylate reductase [Candidatus Paracaedibacter symbiosus]|uniref:pyrroline-5-carboxylate reductase n=1 Tax=Candidatus Paracaedibacter symbiosus TaxID=244582 RepID=UPI00050972BC|nr:pyrroline-5-carboxylate reductase [Candidatus Paracaedibacter symbiosus]